MTTTSETLESAEIPRAKPSGELAARQLLGRYEILFPIASGGMASVYAARLSGEGSFQKPVALKCMLPHLARDPRFVAMFMDEAALAARIQSPYVVPVLELSRHDDETLFMVLELVIGVSLRELFDALEHAHERVPPRVACAVIVQAARGLQDAHDARSVGGEPLGIIHRDVSPHNVLVGVDGRARLSDFGIARAVERTAATQTGELKGKLPYFSPEQVRCADLDARSDVFSLGIVAWELFTGARLFQAGNPLATAQAVAAKSIPRVDALRSDVPSAVADVIEHALERDLARRAPSAESVATALTRAAESSCGVADAREVAAWVRTICGARVERLERELTEALREPTSARRAVRDGRARPRTKRWLVMALGLAIGGGLGLLASASRERDTAAAAPPVSRAPAVVVAAPPAAPNEPAPAPAPPLDAQPAASAPEPEVVTAPAKTPEPRADTPRKKGKRAARRRVTKASEPAPKPAPAASEGLLRGLDEFDRERSR